MKPEEVVPALQDRARKIRDAHGGASEPIVRRAKTIAGSVRTAAARAGHSVGIRVVEKPNGVRVTVTGPQAVRYKKMIEAELARQLPEARAEIRTLITRKSR